MRKVVGDNYPLFFKTKEDFQSKLKNLPKEFKWELPNYDEQFKENVLNSINEIMDKERKQIPMTPFTDMFYQIPTLWLMKPRRPTDLPPTRA